MHYTTQGVPIGITLEQYSNNSVPANTDVIFHITVEGTTGERTVEIYANPQGAFEPDYSYNNRHIVTIPDGAEDVPFPWHTTGNQMTTTVIVQGTVQGNEEPTQWATIEITVQ